MILLMARGRVRMKPLNQLLIVFALLSVCSCRLEEKRRALYYPMDSLVTAQVVYLTRARATLTKHTTINTRDTLTVVPDSAGWRKELSIFDELGDINKPVNQKQYQVDDGLKDIRSNLTVKSIHTTDDKMPIASMKIFYQDVPAKVRKIEAEVRQGSALYGSTRTVTLEFQDVNRQPVLTSYSLVGGQKIFLGDSVIYRIDGTIALSN